MMKDYHIVLELRCESKPETWIVDCLYEQLNQKINEDILYWKVDDLQDESNKQPTQSEEQTDDNTDAK